MSETVLLHRDEAVSVISLNRPEKLNAINTQLKTELVAALNEADADPETRVILLRANGRSFCAGYDLGSQQDPARKAWRTDPVRWHEYLRNAAVFELMLHDLKKPVIASVRGHAVGAGCELAALCDLTICSDDAQFGEPEIRFCQPGPAFVLPWLIGLKRAREILFFGDLIGANVALEIGLVNKVVPTEDLEAASIAYAKRLALVSAEALKTVKLAVNRGLEAGGFKRAMDAGVDVLPPVYSIWTEESREFFRKAEETGLRTALDWRGQQFADR